MGSHVIIQDLVKKVSYTLFPGEHKKIGRDPRCDIPTLEDQDPLFWQVNRSGRNASSHVSGHHANIWYEGSEVYLADVGSKNGTYLNGELVVGNMIVPENSTITLGRFYRLRVIPPKQAKLEKKSKKGPGSIGDTATDLG